MPIPISELKEIIKEVVKEAVKEAIKEELGRLDSSSTISPHKTYFDFKKNLGNEWEQFIYFVKAKTKNYSPRIRDYDAWLAGNKSNSCFPRWQSFYQEYKEKWQQTNNHAPDNEIDLTKPIEPVDNEIYCKFVQAYIQQEYNLSYTLNIVRKILHGELPSEAISINTIVTEIKQLNLEGRQKLWKRMAEI